jgi:CDP-diacylglycerol---serine O-phosphatidyltransferase
MKKNIPNFITLGNLLAGVVALVVDSLELSLLLIFIAAVLDFLDGLVARLLGVSGEMGKQLDSLADVVSFGVVPGVLVFRFLNEFIDPVGFVEYFIVSTPLLMALAGAWRLARFNIDTEQTNYFKGLPIPANGIFWIGYLMLFDPTDPIISDLTVVIPLTIVMTIVMSLIMISKIKILNFKVKSLQWQGNQSRYVFLIIATFIIFWSIFNQRPFLAVPACILLYLVTSIIHYYILQQNEVQS